MAVMSLSDRGATPRIRTPLQDNVAARLGVLPNFFCTAASAPGLIDRLWDFARSAYFDSPLPSLFKERLFVHLSRFCEVRYCIVRHVGFLVGHGYPAGDAECEPQTIAQAVAMLRRPIPGEAGFERAMARLEAEAPTEGMPSPGSQREADLFDALTVIFLEPLRSLPARRVVGHAFGEANLEMLTAFLAFVRTAHYWTETHPELEIEPDMLALMSEHGDLAHLLLDQSEAERTWSPMERARLLTALAARETQQDLLLGLIQAQRETDDPARIRELATEAVGRHLGAGVAGFVTVDSEHAPSLTACWTDGQPVLLALPEACATTLRAGRVAAVADTSDGSDPAGNAAEGGVRALLAVPMMRDGVLEGGIVVGQGVVREWTEAEIGLVRDVATRTWNAVERAQAGNALRDLNETLEARIATALADQRVTEDALRQAQKMEAVGQLTGGVAHDFNNLLTIVRSSVDFLRRPDLPEARKTRYLDAVSDTVDRAARLTSQLLAFARRQTLNPEVFDVGERLRAVADMLDTVTGARIRIETVIPDGSCSVRADRSQFETALVNMAVNARDAMDGEGTLRLEVRCGCPLPPLRGHAGSEATFVALSVTDEGVGIAPELVERIFEPFYTTKDVGKGTGLGLSQVFGFTKQSGGDVAVSSEVGRGTTFTLYLPEVEPKVTGEQVPESVERQVPIADGQRVLVVEDNIEVGRFCTQILEDLGYATTWAANAEEALDRLGTDGAGFQAVFSDVVMPGMGGLELARCLRTRLPGMPVVLASGYSHVLSQDDAHGFEVMHKPYSAEQIGRVLRRVIREPAVAAGPKAEAATLPTPVPPPDADGDRTALLARYRILDSGPEAVFDGVVMLARTLCAAPVALISFVDSNRQWFKARSGFNHCQTDLRSSVCSHAIRQRTPLVIPDLTRDERTRRNPLVTGEPHIRFYAGAPLLTPEGEALGSLCVIDEVPRPEGLSPEQSEGLQALAAQVMAQLELRRALAERDAAGGSPRG
ncbi:GAF domain-containing protein [Methylobacterium sp. E-065]|uniref:GAF domain-containing protein n=1 Tax=Methylobacterium sp. E-065 TaxID=2836583 RepID=UPI001FBA9648|nr:GAF domain-containing protein [Methylobacterium sp. E-065]MCJ2018348.1 GAF domain-containing protein [Methylobacterium sp. E-065]